MVADTNSAAVEAKRPDHAVTHAGRRYYEVLCRFYTDARLASFLNMHPLALLWPHQTLAPAMEKFREHPEIKNAMTVGSEEQHEL